MDKYTCLVVYLKWMCGIVCGHAVGSSRPDRYILMAEPTSCTILSVWPSVCGWYAVVYTSSVFISFHTVVQSAGRNLLSLSEITMVGNPQLPFSSLVRSLLPIVR